MTQALLNSLNIIKESSRILKEKSYTDAGNDFAKILDMTNSKAADSSRIQKTDEKNSTINQNTITTITNKNDNKDSSENIKNSDNTKKNDTKDVKPEADTKINDTENKKVSKDDSDKKETVTADSEEDTKTELNTDTKQETVLQNIILEAAIETVVAECLVGKGDSDNGAETAENSEEADTQEDNEEEQNTITENTTTDEAPTMQKELNTLENPTAALILQTQIKTAVKHIAKDNQTQNQNSAKEQEVKLKDTEINSNLKSFENDMSKLSGMNAVPKTDTTEKSEVLKMKTLLNEKVVKDLNVRNIQSQGAQSGDTEGEAFTQSPQEQVVKVMIQGDLKTDTGFETVAKSTVLKQETVSPSKIIEQISKQMENLGRGSKLTMILNPESLGKINIQLVTTKTGLTAQLTVATAEARDILMKGLEGLKENLLSQGISIDNVSIKLEEAGNEENQFDWTEQEGSRGGNKQQESRRQKDEEKQRFEQLMFEYNNGNV